MPWTVATAPPTAKNYSAKCKEVWVRVANAGLAQGKSEEDAIKIAHTAAKNCTESK